MVTARMAERYALIAWNAFTQLTASEIAAQECIAGTPKDFEAFALSYLAEAFLVGHPRKIAKRIDHTSGHAAEPETGEYHFELPENRELLTYAQAKLHLDQTVPANLRAKFKRLHAKGHSPWAAYSVVMAEWEAIGESMGDSATPPTVDDDD